MHSCVALHGCVILLVVFTFARNSVRSLAACEQLYGAGFQNLFWVQGGLEAAEEEVGIGKRNNYFIYATPFVP
jgi:hypothetical protein